MNAVGIDVSKGKSTVAILRPFGEIIVAPYDVTHTPTELRALAKRIKELNGESKIVMEFTGKYYEPIAQFLHNEGLFVAVVNPVLIHNYGINSLRKVKTDKKDALKLAAYALDRWSDLTEYFAQENLRLLLKSYNRQYNHYTQIKITLKNNLIALLDQTFPNVDTLFNKSTQKSNGHTKWIDFVAKFPHVYSVSQKSFSVFSKSYLFWCRKYGYQYTAEKARRIYDFAHNCIPSLPFNESTGLLISRAVVQLNCIMETVTSLADEMAAVASNLPEYDIAISFFGISPLTASFLIAEIGDIRRFHSKHALVAFAGIDAPPYQSGNLDIKSRSISKRGSPYLRKTLFLIMNVIYMNAPADNCLYQYMEKKRNEGKHYFVCLIAAANKFLRIYYAKVNARLSSAS